MQDIGAVIVLILVFAALFVGFLSFAMSIWLWGRMAALVQLIEMERDNRKNTTAIAVEARDRTLSNAHMAGQAHMKIDQLAAQVQQTWTRGNGGPGGNA